MTKMNGWEEIEICVCMFLCTCKTSNRGPPPPFWQTKGGHCGKWGPFPGPRIFVVLLLGIEVWCELTNSKGYCD